MTKDHSPIAEYRIRNVSERKFTIQDFALNQSLFCISRDKSNIRTSNTSLMSPEINEIIEKQGNRCKIIEDISPSYLSPAFTEKI
jgi:hypothetical protein